MNSNGFERRRVVRMIRRPRQPSWDYNDTFTSTESEPRSYSVIRRVRRLQTRTSPILTSSQDFASPSSPRQVVLVRKRKLVAFEPNEVDTSFEEPSRIRRYDEPWSDNIQDQSLTADRKRIFKDSKLGGLTSKCTKLCVISTLIGSLLTAAVVAAIIIPIMIKWKESSTQTSEPITTATCTETTPPDVEGNPIVLVQEETYNLRNRLQLTVNFLSTTNSNQSNPKTDLQYCAAHCNLTGNWTIPKDSRIIAYELSFIGHNENE